jgi:hypothetical protein
VIIANPIYDAVFKYLMDDPEIARGLISTILGEEVVELTVQPQETTAENLAHGLTVFRLDFKATIRTAAGETKKVLIELQKAKHLFDVMRFRRYLGENYRREDQLGPGPDGRTLTAALPIVTIYILGFRLENVEAAVLEVGRTYRDAVTRRELHIREPFIEQLTHDCYAIQIPRLKVVMQTRLEKVLQVFSQEFATGDLHQLNFQGDGSDPLVQRLLDKLTRAVASEQVRRQMEVEDEIDHVFERELREKNELLAEKDRKIAEQDQLLEEERRQKEEKDRLLEEERRQKEEKDRLLEAALRELEELKKRLKGE